MEIKFGLQEVHQVKRLKNPALTKFNNDFILLRNEIKVRFITFRIGLNKH